MREGSTGPGNPLLTLIELGQRARGAASAAELAFLAVNDTRALVPYRQAALWFDAGGVHTLSGVVDVEANAPYAQWLERLCEALAPLHADCFPVPVGAADVPDDVAREWHDWLPPALTWIALPAHAGQPGGALLLASEQPLDQQLYPLLREWMEIWLHAVRAQARPGPWAPAQLGARLRGWWSGSSQRPRWRRPAAICGAVVAVLLCPVRLTVLAPGELVPANPATIRAPLDGVIEQFAVRPNQPVKAGQPLFSFDQAPIASRLDVAHEALATAQAEYRQAAQIVLSDPRSRAQLAGLLGKVAEKEADAAFLEGQAKRSRVVSPRDGIALFDDPTEWIGRPVQTGERILQVASGTDAEIEAWVPIGDAIPLADKAPVSLYLAATPLSSLSGALRYMSHRAVPRPDGSFAYRVRARLDGAAGQRIGLKGTAKLYGGWVPLGYWVLRRPLASVRQFIAY
jgi:hypothetical protein